jgi:hypothetical protein
MNIFRNPSIGPMTAAERAKGRYMRSPDGHPDGQPPAGDPNAVSPQVDPAPPQTTDRPEWLPEKFWVDGQPAYDKLAQSYGELEKMRGNMKETLAQELEQQRLAARPETPDAYALPQDERLDEELMASSPVVQWWRTFAHEQGYNQEQFEAAIKTYAEVQIQQVEEGHQQEMQKLGENAAARVEAVQLWANNFFEAGELEAISMACTTAEGVAAMEKIMDKLKGTGNVDPAVFEKKPEVTRSDIEKMMQDRRYWHPADRDPAFVRQVEEFFSKSYS